MKRYMVFAFGGCYPNGGMNDFEDSYDTWEEAWEHINSDKEDSRFEHDFYHIYDTKENDLKRYETDYEDINIKEI